MSVCVCVSTELVSFYDMTQSAEKQGLALSSTASDAELLLLIDHRIFYEHMEIGVQWQDGTARNPVSHNVSEHVDYPTLGAKGCVTWL